MRLEEEKKQTHTNTPVKRENQRDFNSMMNYDHRKSTDDCNQELLSIMMKSIEVYCNAMLMSMFVHQLSNDIY